MAAKGWGWGVERWSDRKQWKIRAMMRRPHSLPISNLSLFRPFQSCGFFIMCNSDNGGNGGEVRVKRLGACGLKDKRSSTPRSFQICHFSDPFNLVVCLSVLSPAAPPRQPTLLNGELWGQREKQVVMVGALISGEGMWISASWSLYPETKSAPHTHKE